MQNPLVEQFKVCYRNLHNADMKQIAALYGDDVLFRDPVHEIRGFAELEQYLTSVCTDLSECRFEFLDQLVSETSAYIKWVMHFRHPRLGNRPISVRGVSHLRYSDRIDFHEDFYDMGAMLYEQLPLLGRVTRWLRQRLAA